MGHAVRRLDNGGGTTAAGWPRLTGRRMVGLLMRVSSLVRLLILGAVCAGSCAGCAGSEEPVALPVNDDFSDCSTGWSTDTDEFVSLTCTAGVYRVLIKNPELPQNARVFFSSGVKSLSVAADATRRAGPRTASGSEFLAYGVGCWKSRAQGYLFLLSPDGAWGIERVRGNRPSTALAGSETANAIPGLRRVNRIQGVCVGGGREPTRLVLYVNGKRMAARKIAPVSMPFPGSASSSCRASVALTFGSITSSRAEQPWPRCETREQLRRPASETASVTPVRPQKVPRSASRLRPTATR